MSLKISSRGLQRRKLRSGLIVLAVALSVSLLVAVNVANNSITIQVGNLINTALGDTDIIVNRVTGEPFDQGNLSIVSNDAGIKAVSPRLGGPLYYINESLVAPVTLVGVIFNLEDKFWQSNISLNLLTPNINSCIATAGIATRYNLTVGSTITISRIQVIPPLHPPSESLWTLTVVGIADGTGFSGALITNLPVAQQVFGNSNELNEIVASVQNIGDTTIVRDRVQNDLGNSFQVQAPKQDQLSQYLSMFGAIGGALNMIAIVSLAVACILIMNSLLMSVNERKYEVGVLRSIGSSRGTVFRIFLVEGFFFGVIGSILGTILGVFLSQFLAAYMGNAVGVGTPDMTVTPGVLVFGVLAGVGITILGSIYPAISASRTNIVQAIRPQIRGAGRRKLKTAIKVGVGVLFLLIAYFFAASNFNMPSEQQTLGNLFNVNTMLAVVLLIPAGLLLIIAAAIGWISSALSYIFIPILRNRRTIATRTISRNRRRSSLTVSMVAIGISFAVLMGGLTGSIMAGITDLVNRQIPFDITVASMEGRIPTSYADNLTHIDGVDKVTYLAMQPAKIESKVTPLVGVDAKTFSTVWHVGLINSTRSVAEIFADLSGSNTSMVMASGLAGELNVNAGDNVSVLVEGGRLVNFTVIAIFSGSQFISFGPVSDAEMALVSYDALVGFYPSTFQNSQGADMFFVKAQEGGNVTLIADEIRDSPLGATLKDNLFLLTTEDAKNNSETMFSKIFAIFQVLIAVALMVSLLGMTITMVMSVLERKREIGILRAIGTSKTQVAGMIMGESLTLGTLGLIIGLIIGALFLNYFVGLMGFMGFPVTLITPYDIFLYVALASIAISVVSAAYPAYKASGINVIDAIRYG